jgi:hypothetical protein
MLLFLQASSSNVSEQTARMQHALIVSPMQKQSMWNGEMDELVHIQVCYELSVCTSTYNLPLCTMVYTTR